MNMAKCLPVCRVMGRWLQGMGAALALLCAGGVQAGESLSQWQFTAHAHGEAHAEAHDEVLPQCALAAQGDVHDVAGADVQLRCAPGQSWLGSLQLALPANTMQLRRVRLQVEMRSDETLPATAWLKTISHDQTLMFEDDTEQALLDDVVTADGWHVRVMELPVDINVAQVRMGVLLQGRGNVSLRNVRLLVSQPGALSSEAARYLDEAIKVLRQQLAWRDDLHWNVLEPQMRLLAQGAQQTTDVYAAIRYVLAVADDRRNMLVTPELARMFNATYRDAQQVALADGAQLVLARSAAVRTAQTVTAPDTSVMP